MQRVFEDFTGNLVDGVDEIDLQDTLSGAAASSSLRLFARDPLSISLFSKSTYISICSFSRRAQNRVTDIAENPKWIMSGAPWCLRLKASSVKPGLVSRKLKVMSLFSEATAIA